MLRFLIIIAVVIGLNGCSMFTPVKNPTLYVINTVPESIPKRHSDGSSLVVITPDANQLYSSSDMAYTTSPYQVAYYAKNSWAEPPAQMLKPLMIDTLQKTHHYQAVSTADVLGQNDYVLHTQLQQLQQDFYQGRSYIHLKILAQLVRSNTGKIVATKFFDITEPAPQLSPYGGVVAANLATEKFLRQLAVFCLSHS
jgi:cholesterol transport system auxiliary component